MVCLECGKELTGRKRKYCDRRCSHKPANRKWQKGWRKRTPKPELQRIARRNQLKYFYGLTIEQFNIKFAQQGYACDCCGVTEAKWCVDHCHKTDKLRGIVCYHCNIGLGHFRDDPDRLMAAVAYLKKHI